VSGDDALPALANRTVPIVEAVLEINRREVIALVATTCWRHTFDHRGYVDRTRADEGRRLAVSTLDGICFNEPGSNVRTIVPQLAGRRLTREFRGVLTNVQGRRCSTPFGRTSRFIDCAAQHQASCLLRRKRPCTASGNSTPSQDRGASDRVRHKRSFPTQRIRLVSAEQVGQVSPSIHTPSWPLAHAPAPHRRLPTRSDAVAAGGCHDLDLASLYLSAEICCDSREMA